MRCEVVAVGTELLLGQIVDTNSSWIGEHLALAGIDSHFQTKVGDNLERIVSSLRLALERSDAVIVCGGLGPTQDDITRQAIAEVMGVELVRDESLVERIREKFGSRGRAMADNNLLQADLPVGARAMDTQPGTAPGLICPVGDMVLYAVPGVPYEMQVMVGAEVIPDLQERMGERAAIVSRVLRTWGLAESSLAELVAPRLDALDAVGNPTIAFLASGIEGIKVRLTAKAPTEAEALALIEAEDAELRGLLGSLVFGVDDDTMETEVCVLLEERGLTLAVAESMTGGLVASRLVDVPGSSKWFKGGIVAYDSEIKFDLLDVRRGPVVSEEAAIEMAEGVRKRLGGDVGLSVTGEDVPAEQEGQPVGTVWLGFAIGDTAEAQHLRLPGGRQQIRQFATISLMDQARKRLLEKTNP
ncbi:MAG: competence/damage-inducible protein CinA-like protein [Actinomycetia bacterium]|nr:competence/damage-inducible protein CinA-like protein [Actinomycetes bacterium]